MNRGRHWTVTSSLLAGAMLAPACGGSSDPQSQLEEPEGQVQATSTPEADATTEQARSHRDRVRGLARAYGIEELPDVEMIREVTIFERPQVIADCLTGAGFPTEVSEDGAGWGGELLEGQEQQHKEATIRCLLQYPMMDRYLQPETDDQLRVRYEWTRDEVVPCMEELGYEAGAMPSFETYLASARSGGGLWQPFHESPPEVLRPMMAEMDEKCPPLEPPVDQLWPDGSG